MLKSKLNEVMEQYLWEMTNAKTVSPRTKKLWEDLLDKVSMLEDIVNTDVGCKELIEENNSMERYYCELCKKEVFAKNRTRHEACKHHRKNLAIKLGQYDIISNTIVGLKPPINEKQKVLVEGLS